MQPRFVHPRQALAQHGQTAENSISSPACGPWRGEGRVSPGAVYQQGARVMGSRASSGRPELVAHPHSSRWPELATPLWALAPTHVAHAGGRDGRTAYKPGGQACRRNAPFHAIRPATNYKVTGPNIRGRGYGAPLPPLCGGCSYMSQTRKHQSPLPVPADRLGQHSLFCVGGPEPGARQMRVQAVWEAWSSMPQDHMPHRLAA